MHDRSDWTEGAVGPRFNGARRYAHLTEFSRPCATCGAPFSIYVTKKIANGFADTNAFALRNCEAHRRRRGPVKNDAKERTMAEELDGMYATERQLRAEIEQLKNKSQKMPWEA